MLLNVNNFIKSMSCLKVLIGTSDFKAQRRCVLNNKFMKHAVPALAH